VVRSVSHKDRTHRNMDFSGGNCDGNGDSKPYSTMISTFSTTSTSTSTPTIPNTTCNNNNNNNNNTDCIDLSSSHDNHHQLFPNNTVRVSIQKIYNQSHTGPFPSKLASILAKETIPKVKIKLEPGYTPSTTTNTPTHNLTTTNTDTDTNTPRNPQEHGKVSLLRQMGFTDVHEMLVGLRHIEKEDELGLLDSEMHV